MARQFFRYGPVVYKAQFLFELGKGKARGIEPVGVRIPLDVKNKVQQTPRCPSFLAASQLLVGGWRWPIVKFVALSQKNDALKHQARTFGRRPQGRTPPPVFLQQKGVTDTTASTAPQRPIKHRAAPGSAGREEEQQGCNLLPPPLAEDFS